MLKWAAVARKIRLKYLDKTGLNLWVSIVYTWRKSAIPREENNRKKGNTNSQNSGYILFKYIFLSAEKS